MAKSWQLGSQPGRKWLGSEEILEIGRKFFRGNFWSVKALDKISIQIAQAEARTWRD